MAQREIKFRYRYSDGKDFIYKEFTLEEISNGDCYEVLSDQPLLKNYKLVGRDEWTGLKDKNGKEIYEGDVVQFLYTWESYIPDSEDYYERERLCKGQVVFNAGKWCVSGEGGLYDYVSYGLEIIGDIFSSPELIK